MLSDIVDVVMRSGKMVGSAKGFSVSVKGTKENLVTSMDVENERFLRRELTALIPGSSFKGEEGDEARILEKGYTWIVDPIDGTANFSRGIPETGISVALMKDGKPLAGVVHNPFNGAMYCAEKGKGAFKGGIPINVRRRPLGECLFFTAWSAYDKSISSKCFEVSESLYPQCNDIRRIGTAAVELCMLAEGAGDMFFEARLSPWDFAAASVILEEAGGLVRSLDGPLDYENGGPVLAAADPGNLDVL
ncbi:MAG: inositol monophosphatase [Candidatus Methanomethylophilaceae archaeon]|nr:inositol monophosphatase [Candidatus Methanomethylophilaceae archaeon]